jgi:hypothetical protein
MGQTSTAKSKSKSIYLTLKPDLVENNTNSMFTCNLNEPLNVTSSTEVALTDIIYSNTFMIDFGLIQVQYPEVLNIKEVKTADSYEAELEKVVEATKELKLESKFVSLKKKIENIKTTQNENQRDQLLAELNTEHVGLIDNIKSIIQLVKQYSADFVDIKKVGNVSDIVAFVRTFSFSNIRKEEVDIIKKYLIEIAKEAVSLQNMIENKNSSVHVYNYKAEDRESKFYEDFFDTNVFFYKNFKPKPYIKILNMSDQFKALIRTQKPVKNFFQHFCVYTNIIEDNFMLNRNEPVLKLVKLQGHAREIIEKSYDRPEYFSVNKTYINRIKIEIRDNFEKLVDFKTGPIIIKLHFRTQK